MYRCKFWMPKQNNFFERADFTPAVNIIFLIQIQVSDVTLCFIATALFRMAKNDHTQQVA